MVRLQGRMGRLVSVMTARSPPLAGPRRYLAGEGPLARVPTLVNRQVARSVAAVLAEGTLEQLDETQVAAHVFPHLLPVLTARRACGARQFTSCRPRRT